MNKARTPLNQIINKFDETTEPTIQPTEELTPAPIDSVQTVDSLTSKLANPKKKVTKIRFTLDLDKPLDDRLNKSAKQLNRSKADVARVALERLLDELEQEWKQ
jgi:predicted DNA-binding protein